jgi:PadR family transcriptional regulator PadR
MEDVRITVAVAVVLKQFLEDHTQQLYGYDLMRSTGFASGKLYPILLRLERAGWLTRELESGVPADHGRPLRRMYRLTPDGARAARLELAALSQQIGPPVGSARLRPAGGISR